MHRYERTGLWQSTLAAQLESDAETAARRRLRSAYEGFRERATVLAQELARDLPEFTVHDISHIDALWEMADLVAGTELHLNPAEAFVLGGSILIHDLGLGLAAYPEGVRAIQSHPLWADTRASLAKRRVNSEQATVADSDAEMDRAATGAVLRQLHAERAEKLALASWPADATTFHLIEDAELREAFGRIIGLVAHSHWWPVSELVDRLPERLGALGGFPNSWTVDSIKLACLLRTADAIHLDDRRAPAFLRVLRRPSGESVKHWIFQERLYQPRLDVDRLVFSAKGGFALKDAAAWWLCYDTLRSVHHELEQVDALLADSRRPRLAAKGVAYVDTPRRLVRLIPTEGWHPIDATLKVGAVANLVAALGGKELYGMNLHVPLRELVQNASDAIRARRLLERYPNEWGAVRITAWEEEGGPCYVEVTDNGVGMSVAVLSGALLDFGTSLWGSPAMHSEFPGLESMGFESAGRFGIGFFSSFMWGDRVRVRTRRYEAGREDTWVLDFADGLHARPILRRAAPDEVLKEGGTSVRIEFRSQELWTRLWKEADDERFSPREMIARLCPTASVTIEVSHNGSPVATAVEANDWMSISGDELLKRIKGLSDEPRSPDELPSEAKSRKAMMRVRSRLGSRMDLIKDSSSNIVGRGCLVPADWDFITPHGAVTVGGFRASTLHGFAGVLLGKPATAARTAGIPFLHGSDLAAYATREANVLARECRDPSVQASAAHVVYAFGGDPVDLKVVRHSGGWLNCQELYAWARSRSTCTLTSDFFMYTARHLGAEPTIAPGVLATESGWTTLLSSAHFHDENEWLHHESVSPGPGKKWLRTGSLEYLVYATIARAWDSDILTLLSSASDRTHRKVASVAGRSIKDSAVILTRATSKGKKQRRGKRVAHEQPGR